MLKRILRFLLVVCAAGCVEPYEFVIENNEPTLVIEAFVSDKSFKQTLAYPSDGRYFAVKLTTTTDVTNVRPLPVRAAQVQLFTDQGESFQYTEPNNAPGYYFLLDDEFKAERGVAYKVSVKLQDETVYESDWVSMPTVTSTDMGQIGFREVETQKYVFESNEEVLRTVKGIWTEIAVPENTTNEPLYYRWSYTSHWIYIAPLSSSVDPGHICWATNPLSVQNYSLLFDRTGKYNKDLFFMESVRNHKIYEKYSTLIVQHVLTEDFYFFWKEMQEQNEGGAIFDKPPFNLRTNFHSLAGDKKVSGYFGVVQEQAKRWYFSIKDLSYHVENTAKADCQIPFTETPPECFDCREYFFGIPTNVKPQWWEN
jgi:hypothetical protein